MGEELSIEAQAANAAATLGLVEGGVMMLLELMTGFEQAELDWMDSELKTRGVVAYMFYDGLFYGVLDQETGQLQCRLWKKTPMVTGGTCDEALPGTAGEWGMLALRRAPLICSDGVIAALHDRKGWQAEVVRAPPYFVARKFPEAWNTLIS